MPTGHSSSVFRRLRESGEPFLDNSARIPGIIRFEFPFSASLLAPHGFGKSAFLSMAADFYDFRKNSKALFEGLEISKDKAFCAEHMNKHPVIFLQFKDFVFSTEEEGIAKWVDILADTVLQFPEVLESDAKHQTFTKDLSDFLRHRPRDRFEISFVLQNLVLAINERWGEPILLVDDYDVPALCAERTGLGREFTDIWVRCLEFAVNCNCDSVTKNGILVSGVKPAFITSAWPSDRLFERMISHSLIRSHDPMVSLFDEPHVKGMLGEAGAADRFDKLARLCGGYKTNGGRRLIHPESVMAFLRALKTDSNARPEPIQFDDEVLFDSVLRGAEQYTADKIGEILAGEDVRFEGGIPLTMDQSEMGLQTTFVVMIHYGVLNLKPGRGFRSRYFSVEIPNESARAALERLKDRLLQTGKRKPVPRRKSFHFV